ncbi:MAG: hypothetical protein IKB25_06525 [Lentisphaeria bacterium]|nr:hypothetical protein [Lentisphaeria bacterium]
MKQYFLYLKRPEFWLVFGSLLFLIAPTIIWEELKEEEREKIQNHVLKNIPEDERFSENHAEFKKPSLQITRFQDYPEEFGAYYNDAFPFRNYLVWKSRSITTRLNNFFNPNIIAGKDGYLFYTVPGSPNNNEAYDYTGAKQWTPAQMDIIVKRLDGIRKGLKEMDIDFCVVIAPNKMAVYPEKLPAKRAFERAEKVRAERVVEYAAVHAPELKIKYLDKELLEAKKQTPHPLFQLEDTHWNMLGGYISFREIMKMINGPSVPELKNACVVPDKIIEGGDLRNQLGSGKKGKYQYHKVKLSGVKEVKIVPENSEERHRWSDNPEAPDKRTVWFYRDSFGDALLPYMSSVFRRMDFFHRNVPIRRVQFSNPGKRPHVVVFQIVERNLRNLDEVNFESRKNARLNLFQ